MVVVQKKGERGLQAVKREEEMVLRAVKREEEMVLLASPVRQVVHLRTRLA